MKVIVESVAKKCNARICRITKFSEQIPACTDTEIQTTSKCKEMVTPMVLLHTRAANIPHVSKEVYDLCNFESDSFLIPLSTTIHMQTACHAFNKGIASFAGHSNIVSCISLKDPAEEMQIVHQDKHSMGIFTRGGKINVDSERYMDVIETFKPDFYHTLCDGETLEDSSRKRITKAIDKSKQFFTECLNRHLKSSVLKGSSMLIAAVEGGYLKEARQNMIQFLSKHEDHIGGYLIDGLHSNGTTACNLTALSSAMEILEFCVKSLPPGKLKFMFGSYSPLTILELVKAGVDVFDNSYAYLATQTSHALVFDFKRKPIQESEKSDYAINLTEAKYKEDFTPFKKDCQCLACQKHTRAYVNHLVNCRELLASTLLMIHNTHHYIEFFKTIREAVKEDTLDELIELIKEQYRDINLKVTTKKEKSERLDESIASDSC